MTHNLGRVCRVLQKVFNFVDIKPFWLSHFFLFSVPKVTIAQTPRDTIAHSPSDTVAQSPRDTVAQSPRDTVAQSPRDTIAHSPRDTVAQSPRDTVAQSPRDTVAQSPRDTIAHSPRDTVAQSPRDTVAQSPRDTVAATPRSRHLFFLGNLLSCPPTSRLRPRLLLLVRVVHQRVVRVGGPNVTAACLYPALRLDKLYAALIRCLVLWTVTKQFLVSYFKGLYLLTGGSDVTRGISCDSSVH